MAEFQTFEEEAFPLLTPTVHEHLVTYRPLFSLLSEPIDVLHCEEVRTKCALKELRGTWTNVQARKGEPSSERHYSVRFGPLGVRDARLRLFSEGKLVEEKITDSEGRASFTLPSSEPTRKAYQTTLLPSPAPVKTPLQEQFELTVWLVTCKITNRTDRWWRFAGRTFEISLPRKFVDELPISIIGLTAPYGTQIFADIVPVFGDRNITLEYGISAWCNTPEPYPPAEKCREYRRNTWWRFEVEAFNGETRKSVSGDLNLDRHLKVTFSTDDISGEVVRPSGADT